MLGVSLTAQQGKHLNPMVNLLSENKAIFGLGVPVNARAGGPGGNRGGGQGGGANAAGAVRGFPRRRQRHRLLGADTEDAG
jgi:hypothetical protein